MENKIPTIKDIAQQLKVSISTVSRALSDHPGIGLRTKQQVQKLAKDLNYVRNDKAVSFKQKKSFVIGVVLPYIREEFFSEAISGMEMAAIEHEYTILFGQSYDNPESEVKVVNAMKKQRVDGLIISLSKQTNNYDHLESLKQYDIPVVYVDRVPPFDAHKVFCNIYQGTIDMVGWLFSRGYKRIALLNGPAKLQATKERFKGYVEGVSRRKLKIDMSLVETSDLSKESTYEAMSKLLSLNVPPTAIISFNDYVHMDAVQFAVKQNIQVNKDIVFLSYANLPITNYTAYPPLVSIEQYPYGQGERAMQMIIRILNMTDEEKSAESVYFTEQMPATLVMHPMPIS